MNKAGNYTLLFILVSGFVWRPLFCAKEGLKSMSQKRFMRADAILDKNGKPTEGLSKLLATLGVKHDGTLGSIVQATQREWLRPAGKERWDAPDMHEDKRLQVLELLDQFGCLKDIQASKKRYNHALVLGALVSRMRSRLAYLLKQWDLGVRFDEIIFLVGERSLHQKLESREVLLNVNNQELPARKDWTLQGGLPETEVQAAKMIFDQANLPDELKKTVRIIFVGTPMQKRADGTMRRPNTGDTVAHWLASHSPKSMSFEAPEERSRVGTCLVISNQPYTGYQDSVMRTFLPKGFEIETIGCAAHDDLPLAVHLDNLARWLYQERKRRAAAK